MEELKRSKHWRIAMKSVESSLSTNNRRSHWGRTLAVTKVVDDARDVTRDAEVHALTQRVRQLKDDVESRDAGSNYGYYCRDPAGYYPDARTCPSGWLQVVPNRTADPTPSAGQ